MLLISKVPRALEMKSKIFGYELADVLLIFLYLSLSNFVFCQTHFKILFVWGGTIGLALALYFLKKDKPDHHLQHLGEYYRAPEVFSAAESDLNYQPYFKKDGNTNERK